MAHQDRIYYFNELRGGGNTFAKGLRRSMRIYPSSSPFFKLLNSERIEKIRADLRYAYEYILREEFLGQYEKGLTLKQIKKTEDYKEMVDIVEQIIEFAFREGMTEEEIVDELRDVEKSSVLKEKSERYRPEREQRQYQDEIKRRNEAEKARYRLFLINQERDRNLEDYELHDQQRIEIEQLLDMGEKDQLLPEDNSPRPRFTTETNIPE